MNQTGQIQIRCFSDRYKSREGTRLTSIPCSHSHRASPSRIITLPSDTQKRCSSRCEITGGPVGEVACECGRRTRKDVPERSETERMGVS